MMQSTISFPCGKKMKNSFMLAPMTNQQSGEDGRLSKEEYEWLVMRAKGGFAMTMTCAAHVQFQGKGFPGQLGIYSEDQKEGHLKLTKGIKSHNSMAIIQLHHAGMRSPKELIDQTPVCPSEQSKYGARALYLDEVERLRDDFILAAKRAKDWGYDGVEIHGAHGYVISQFLSAQINRREDQYGGSLDNRARLLYEIVEGVRQACGRDFALGVRLSPERFGMDIEEVRLVCQKLIDSTLIDFLDVSLWDFTKMPESEAYASKPLLDYFLDLDLKEVALAITGKIQSASDALQLLTRGVDIIGIGRGGILHHDFPQRAMDDPSFEMRSTPVTPDYLMKEGLSEKFVNYMRRWKNFVE